MNLNQSRNLIEKHKIEIQNPDYICEAEVSMGASFQGLHVEITEYKKWDIPSNTYLCGYDEMMRNSNERCQIRDLVITKFIRDMENSF